jgi:RNA polymerase sigma-70 factor (sigma-E family)
VIGGRDRREFEAFVAASSDRLVRTAYLLTGDAGHAEDVVQSALLRTARRWRSARKSPEAYARTVVANLAKDRWRALGRRPAEAPLEHDVPQAPHDGAFVQQSLDRDALMHAARGLPVGQRAVLVLRYFDDLSVEETAAALGVTAGTVKSQTSRALAALRAALAPHDTENPDPTTSKENADAHR